uniref:Uncharacterized protein n=1 Tax=Glossina pallidipes TaxID=7398 RepID=A0A1A9ZIT6_GLOPL
MQTCLQTTPARALTLEWNIIDSLLPVRSTCSGYSRDILSKQKMPSQTHSYKQQERRASKRITRHYSPWGEHCVSCECSFAVFLQKVKIESENLAFLVKSRMSCLDLFTTTPTVV